MQGLVGPGLSDPRQQPKVLLYRNTTYSILGERMPELRMGGRLTSLPAAFFFCALILSDLADETAAA